MVAGRFGPVAAVYPDGSPAIAVPFKVLTTDGSLAALYTTAAGTVARPNPTAADGLGQIDFYAAPGAYDVVMLDTNYTMRVVVYPPDTGTAVELGEVKTQAAAAATWTFSHGLGRIPGVSLYLMDGEEVETDVDASDTQVIATWPSPVAGKMVLT